MIDLKTYTSIQINESFWRKLSPFALDLLCLLLVYYSPQIKRTLTRGGIKTIEGIENCLRTKFPKLYAKVLSNKALAKFLENYPEKIESFISFCSENVITTRIINRFMQNFIKGLPEDKLEEIKNMLK